MRDFGSFRMRSFETRRQRSLFVRKTFDCLNRFHKFPENLSVAASPPIDAEENGAAEAAKMGTSDKSSHFCGLIQHLGCLTLSDPRRSPLQCSR